MEIGGVERSLIGLLNEIDYEKYDVDIMLFKHEGEFLSFLPTEPKLLKERDKYTTFRKSIKQVLQEGHIMIGLMRLIAKGMGNLHGQCIQSKEPGYLVIQYGWRLLSPFLPKLEEEYDIAISFLWPHYFIGDQVRAKKKIGWIHTDYSNIPLNKYMESCMWKRMDNIIAVSESCKESFLSIFPEMTRKIEVLENVLSPEFIYEQSNTEVAYEMSEDPDKINLVTVGRLSHAKGIDDAAYACRDLLDQGYKINWYIVGYGSQERDLRMLIEKLNLQNHFFLLGKKLNPYPYIRACDIYVQPSRYEGKAVTVREAQILGKPVLITNFPTARSQVRAGVDGLITPLGFKGICDGVKRLVDDPELRERLCANTTRFDYSNKAEIQKLYSIIEAEK